MRVDRLIGHALVAGMMIAGASVGPASAEGTFSKDVGPSSVMCDRLQKGSEAWSGCVGPASNEVPAEELFYAGYWLAKSGQYEKALEYLRRADLDDARVRTYIGFATRHLGDVDGAFRHYKKALEIDPAFSVARAYMGEAHLVKGELDDARAQLSHIEGECGLTCGPYVDLQRHIARYEVRLRSQG